MKYLNNAEEFKTWLIEVVYMTSLTELSRKESLFSLEDDVYPEFKALCPREYPCLVYKEYSDELRERYSIQFITKQQVERWAFDMQLCQSSVLLQN